MPERPWYLLSVEVLFAGLDVDLARGGIGDLIAVKVVEGGSFFEGWRSGWELVDAGCEVGFDEVGEITPCWTLLVELFCANRDVDGDISADAVSEVFVVSKRTAYAYIAISTIIDWRNERFACDLLN